MVCPGRIRGIFIVLALNTMVFKELDPLGKFCFFISPPHPSVSLHRASAFENPKMPIAYAIAVIIICY